MSHAVNIPGGPRIEVVNQDKDARRRQVAAANARMAFELASCSAWSWYVNQCLTKASVLEARLSDVNAKHDPRDEDRWRGEIAAYRGMPALIEKAVAHHARLQEKQQSKEQKA